jgi:hypothetical protein
MENELKKLVSELINKGYSLEDIKSHWGNEEFKKSQEIMQAKLDELKKRYRDKYLGKYILIDKNSNIDIIPGFSKSIDIEDIIPFVSIKIIKVDRVTLSKDSFNDFRYNLNISGHSISFNILGNRAEIDGDPLEAFESSVSYHSHQYSNSSENFTLDKDGELVYPGKFKVLSPEFLMEILDYYADSQKFAIEFIKNKLS